MNAKDLIKQILLSFEQSSTKIKYNKIYTFEDGPNDITQITLSFGITEYGNLKQLIKNYCLKNGPLTTEFTPYIPKIGVTSLVYDKKFIDLLVKAGNDSVMQLCQEEAYDSMYINPAFAWCDKNKFKYDLSRLVVCDSYLQSGCILQFLRKRFPATVDNEKEWVKQYCETRRNWLETHSRVILNKTVYRMDFMLNLIKKDDWDLTQPSYNANGVIIKTV